MYSFVFVWTPALQKGLGKIYWFFFLFWCFLIVKLWIRWYRSYGTSIWMDFCKLYGCCNDWFSSFWKTLSKILCWISCSSSLLLCSPFPSYSCIFNSNPLFFFFWKKIWTKKWKTKKKKRILIFASYLLLHLN